MWTIKFRNGTMKRFKFPIRTTPEGSADPYGGKPKANMADIANDEVLFTKGLHAGDRSQFVKS
jgi:adenylylsulfate reductase subunit B